MSFVGDFMKDLLIQEFGERPVPNNYMAVSTSVPMVGSRYDCYRLEENKYGRYVFYSTNTSSVQQVITLSSNVFVAVTRRNYYWTYVKGKPIGNVHFCLAQENPQEGSNFSCYKLDFSGENIGLISVQTSSPVQSIDIFNGLYKVKTRDGCIVCFPIR